MEEILGKLIANVAVVLLSLLAPAARLVWFSLKLKQRSIQMQSGRKGFAGISGYMLLAGSVLAYWAVVASVLTFARGPGIAPVLALGHILMFVFWGLSELLLYVGTRRAAGDFHYVRINGLNYILVLLVMLGFSLMQASADFRLRGINPYGLLTIAIALLFTYAFFGLVHRWEAVRRVTIALFVLATLQGVVAMAANFQDGFSGSRASISFALNLLFCALHGWAAWYLHRSDIRAAYVEVDAVDRQAEEMTLGEIMQQEAGLQAVSRSAQSGNE